MATRRSWANVVTVVAKRATCPKCGCEKFEHRRTEQNGDGTSTRYELCRNCGLAFRVLIEISDEILFPESGKPGIDDR